MNDSYYTIDSQPELQKKSYSLWQPDGSGSTNNKILVESGINSNWKYRQYIQKNANQIMKYNTMQTINNSGNNPYSILNTNTTNHNPHLYTSTHDTNNPIYGFRNSDLKQSYITREQMKSRMISPSIQTNF